MKTWPKYPVIYEINTWVWLQELSQKYKSPVTLANAPPCHLTLHRKRRSK